MYCSHCGAEAAGNFCAACGTALATSVEPRRVIEPEHPPAPTDWADLVDYDVLLRVPEVRDLIAAHAARSTTKMTGEQFLEICDKMISPLTAGVALSPLAKVGQSMYAKLGVKTGKTRTEFLPSPAGRVLVRALCSLAERGHELQTAQSASDGCMLEATLESDMLSFAGKVIVSIERVPQGTKVEALTNIPGQWFDWGKSTRCLATLFDDLRSQSQAA